VPMLDSDLLELPRFSVPSEFVFSPQTRVIAGISTLRLAGVHRAEAGDQLSLIISISAIRIRLG